MRYICIQGTKLCVLDEKFAITQTLDLSTQDLLAVAKSQTPQAAKDLMGAGDIYVPSSMIASAILEKIQEVLSTMPALSLLHQEFYMDATSEAITASISWDVYTIAAINSVEELDKSMNLHAKRLREWFEWSNPIFSRSIPAHEKFAEAIVTNTQEALNPRKVIEAADYDQIVHLAASILTLSVLRDTQRAYVEKGMEKHLPTFTKLAGSQVGAKLLSLAGSAHQLSKMTSSTIQVLGAEKALFRHIKTGSRPPKHGVLFSHPIVAKAREKGKAARTLANALAIAVRSDVYGKVANPTLADELLKKVQQ